MARAWVLVIVGAIGLASMYVAYDLTREPAPGMRVRWRDGTSESRRASLERRYRLVLQPTTEREPSYAYVLMDTSRKNIVAMIKDPEVADTGDVDRNRFDISFWTSSNGAESMWVADRIPIVRQPAIRRTLAGLLAAMMLVGLQTLARSVDWSGRARRGVAYVRRMESVLRHG